VTLVFTDVDGSTQLLHELGPERYAELLGEHRRLLRAAFMAGGGVEVGTQGDAFFFSFPSAQETVVAAAGAQAALSSGSIRCGGF
jgi:class 3 adenylate cyclase